MVYGTPVAELVSESNQVLCCGSAKNLVPDDNHVPSNGHARPHRVNAQVDSKIACSRA